jgi:asparagine synthase (glutamine-hydrolysing)
MCGIAGLVVPQRESIDERAHMQPVRRMIRRMDARGPDAEGLWTGQGVVLGHKRLAIIDLDPRSNQPMTFANERYVLVFNGEIYNYRELKAELESQGELFHTTSDSEVILALYQRKGEKMLPRLRDMFAFAIWIRNPANFSWHAIPTASSPSTMLRLLKACSSPRRSRPCSRANWSHQR